jgi:hypothetical protein
MHPHNLILSPKQSGLVSLAVNRDERLTVERALRSTRYAPSYGTTPHLRYLLVDTS